MLIIKVYRKKNYVVTIQPDIWPDIRYPAKKIGRISGGRIFGNSVSGATLFKAVKDFQQFRAKAGAGAARKWSGSATLVPSPIFFIKVNLNEIC